MYRDKNFKKLKTTYVINNLSNFMHVAALYGPTGSYQSRDQPNRRAAWSGNALLIDTFFSFNI